jgi:hypothetical protein
MNDSFPPERRRSRPGEKNDGLGAWAVVAVEGNDGRQWVELSRSAAVIRMAALGTRGPSVAPTAGLLTEAVLKHACAGPNRRP